MKYLLSLIVLFFAGIFSLSAQTQNVLPEFSVRELTRGKIQVSWNNPYPSCIQLAVQRSTDSSKDFRTIFSAQSPELPANGFVDNKPLVGMKSYYRIFYVLLGGAYYFSQPIAMEVKMRNPVFDVPVAKIDPKKIRTRGTSIAETKVEMVGIYLKNAEIFRLTTDEYKRFRDSINTRTKDGLRRINEHAVELRPAPNPAGKKELYRIYNRDVLLAELSATDYKKYMDSITTKTKDTLYAVDPWRIQLHVFTVRTGEYMYVYKNDSLVAKLEMSLYRNFKDSIATRTKDTLYSINSHQLEIHPFMAKYIWRPSQYVYTNSRGYVTIIVPQLKQHRYRIVFFDEDNSELFHIKSMKEPELVLDKTNFVHAGWFYFELYEDDKLKEKNKFYLSKD